MRHIKIMKIAYYTLFKSLMYSSLYILFFSLLLSCAKTEVVPEEDFQKNLLAGTGSYQNTKRVWRIDSATNNGVVVIKNGVSLATPTSKKIITVTFSRDGSYTDSDGNFGTWTLSGLKDLKLNVLDGISGTKRALKYEVANLNAARLHLKFDSATYKQDLYYNIYN